jgi:hypothetical protein
MNGKEEAPPEGWSKWETELSDAGKAHLNAQRALLEPAIILAIKVRETLGMSQLEMAAQLHLNDAPGVGLLMIRHLVEEKGGTLRATICLDGVETEL